MEEGRSAYQLTEAEERDRRAFWLAQIVGGSSFLEDADVPIYLVDGVGRDWLLSRIKGQWFMTYRFMGTDDPNPLQLYFRFLSQVITENSETLVELARNYLPSYLSGSAVKFEAAILNDRLFTPIEPIEGGSLVSILLQPVQREPQE